MTALDVSPGMVEVARRRAERLFPQSEFEGIAVPAEEADLEPAAFDAVVGRYVLHHVDPERGGERLALALKPTGCAVFLETSARNKLLMFARDHVAGRFGIRRFSTPDERPMTDADIAAFGRPFGYITTEYPVFEFMTMIDRQILRFRSRAASRALKVLDRGLGRSRRIRTYSFRVLVIARHDPPNGV